VNARTATAAGERVRPLQADAVLELLRRHARPGERGEDVLLDRGLLDEHELALALATASGRELVGLRGFVPDARLFLYVPVATALVERVCPLVLAGDTLKVASAYLDPDLSAVEARFPNLALELAVSPRGEILAALAHAAPR